MLTAERVARLPVASRRELERLVGSYPAWQQVYRRDPAGFARDCVRWGPGQGLTDYQAEIVRDLVARGRLAVRSPHGAGKTTTAALVVLWYALTRDGWCDWKVVTTASAWRHLSRYLWPEVRKWARRLDWTKIGRPPLVDGRELLMMAVQLETGSAFAVASDQPWAIEGAHAASLLYVFDEAKAIPAETWDAAEGAFSTAGVDGDEALALAISTPGDTQGRFYDIHRRAPGYDDWTVRHITLDDAIGARRITREWADARKAQWGEGSAVYQNRVLGEFAAADESSVIPLAWVEAAVERWQSLRDDGTLPDTVEWVGVDVADGGEDRSVLGLRSGPVIAELRDVTQPEPGMTMALAGLVAGVIRGKGGTAVVDAIGVGAGVVSRLRELDIPTIAFNAGEGTSALDASGELGFRNKRSAAWWGLRERLHPETGDGIALPDDPRLIGDLTAPRWSVTSAGKIAVESKDDIRKRLGRSTDYADPVVQAFWAETERGPRWAVYDDV